MLETEKRNPKTTHIDKMDTLTALKIINGENYNAVKAVENALPQIEKAIALVVNALSHGGRLIYVGAGTSGRLAVADAAECPPTFGVDYNTVVAVMAGGVKAIITPSEDIEDNAFSGAEDVNALSLTKEDIICGISASGGAEYVAAAMKEGKKIGCKTISVSSNNNTLLGSLADVEIVTFTGAEVIQGSTRMKAGTAQKLVLNMISTCAMIKTGKVYENVMVNLKPTNKKLRRRMINIVASVLDIDDITALTLLEQNEWNIRTVLEKEKDNV